ncbi:unnamed protein product [Linum trigynum]|uniref:SWIM-type domain-containing protein n=1 Tax=Linum trigynum TaxID=586398 RepID=A0AAV2EAC1_9ROSI
MVEVKLGNSAFVVDLKNRTCTCGAWDLSGLPCCHVLSATGLMRLHLEDYVDPFYFVPTVAKVYKVGIPCLVGQQAWPRAEGYPIYPPKQKKMPGDQKRKGERKQVNLRKGCTKMEGLQVHECKKKVLLHCSNCGSTGHNVRKCPNPQTRGSNRGRGRGQQAGGSNRGRGRGQQAGGSNRGRGRGKQAGGSTRGRGIGQQAEGSTRQKVCHLFMC